MVFHRLLVGSGFGAVRKTGNMHQWRYFPYMLVTLAFVGDAGAAGVEPTVPAAEAESFAPYRLGPGDILSIQVLHADEINRLVYQVDQRGECNLPIIGRTRAMGLTAPELESELRTSLKRYINDPQVTVQVQEYKSLPVTIVGAVRNPGTHYLRGRTTLLQAIAMAGGLEKDAGGGVTIKRRKEYGSSAARSTAPFQRPAPGWMEPKPSMLPTCSCES
jgi:protein involved in polysaccharide export with SLBB domain